MPTSTITRSTIPFTIINNTGSTAYLYLHGNTNPIKPEGNTYFMSSLQGDLTPFRPNENRTIGIPVPGGKVDARFPQLDAIRAYFSISMPFGIRTNDKALPIPPSADLSTDPNYQTIWDFVEATWHDYGDRTVLHMNTTQVDAFGLAFEVEHSGFDPSNPQKPITITNGFHLPEARKGIMDSLLKLGAPWSNLLVTSTTQGQVPRRALMPLKAMDLGKFPKDQLTKYITSTILYYQQNKLVFPYAGVNYTGNTKTGGIFVFVPDKAKDDGGNATYTYSMGPINTRQCYAQDIAPKPDDGVGRAICAALGASFLRSTLTFYPEFPVPQSKRAVYYQHDPICQYAKVIHSYGINNHAFCYGYDEVAGDAGGNRDVVKPQSVKITIQRFS